MLRSRQPTDSHASNGRSGSRANGRGQSEVLGVLLLLGITVTGAFTVVALGSVVIQDTQETAAVGQAENAMTQFGSQTSLVAHGPADSQRASFSNSDGHARVDPDAGWMRVEIKNETTGETETVLIDEEPLGTVVYEIGDTTVAYQGGGVWRQTGDRGSSMVSPPEFHYRGQTLTLPLVTVDGDSVLNEDVQISRSSPSEPKYPGPDNDLKNPLRDGKVVVTVHSQYYQAWGNFFEQRTDGEASVNSAAETATIELVVPSEGDTVSDALATSAPGERVELDGGGLGTYVDAYNSSKGGYDDTQMDNGTLRAAGDVDMTGSAEVSGNVQSGGGISVQGNARIGGDAYYTTSKPDSQNVDGDIFNIDGIDSAPSTDTLVQRKVENVSNSDNNDNDETDYIDNNELSFENDEATLDPGEYYLDDPEIQSSEKLILDTGSAGDELVIGIENDLTLSDEANITVTGDGTALVYVKGDLTFDDGTSTHVPDQASQQLWFYGTSDMTLSAEGSQGNPIEIVGVVYAPGGNGVSEATLRHMEFYGSLVVGKVAIDQGTGVHYDQALRESDPFHGDGNAPSVTYLHVSTTQIEVTAA